MTLASSDMHHAIDVDVVRQQVHRLILALQNLNARQGWGTTYTENVEQEKYQFRLPGADEEQAVCVADTLFDALLSRDPLVPFDDKLRALEMVSVALEHCEEMPQGMFVKTDEGCESNGQLTARYVMGFYDVALQAQVEISQKLAARLKQASAPLDGVHPPSDNKSAKMSGV